MTTKAPPGTSTTASALGDPLQHAAEEAARLLRGDGAMIYLLDPASGMLVCANDAGIGDPEARRMIRELRLPVGTGMFGTAVARGTVVSSADYLVDRSFQHSPLVDEIVRKAHIRAMTVAPLVANGEVLGALGAYLRHPRSLDEAQVGLLKALAEHAAVALANQRLVQQLAASEERYRYLVERSPDLIWSTDARGCFTYLSDQCRQLTGYDVAELLGKNWSVIVAEQDREAFQAAWRAAQGETEEQRHRYHLLHRDGRQIPVELRGRETLVDGRSDGAHGSIRDITEIDRLERDLRRQTEELAHRVEAQATLGHITARITAIRAPGEVLQSVVDAARRLLGSDGAHLTTLVADTRILRPIAVAGGLDAETGAWLRTQEFPIPGGINGLAAEVGHAVWSEDYDVDPRIPHEPDDNAVARRLGLRGVAVAPLRIPETGVIGTLAISFEEPHSFTPDELALLQQLADQGAVAIGNARLYEQLHRRAEGQRALAEIATQLTSMRGADAILQRTVDEAARLMRADAARIDLVQPDGKTMRWDFASAGSEALFPREEGEEVVSLDEGVSALAARERRVVRTGDYLQDAGFRHGAVPDAYVARHGVHSVMSAPLLGDGRILGTISLSAHRGNAFEESDAQLLGVLATQAAIAVSNARLYEELRESERRYRHLVDNSPDLVWSADAEGRITYLSESLEARTGWRHDQLVGRHFSQLTSGDSLSVAEEAWTAMQAQPEREQRIRIELPVASGSTSPVEITMLATMVDGRFAGAHGSIRDIAERERLERHLRRQAAELAASNERATLARELHDSVTQALFSMGLTARSLEMLLESDPAAARRKLAELRELQRDALAEMRALIFELRPASLEQDGLVQALRNHAAAVRGRTGLDVRVDVEPDPFERAPLAVEEALYRIAQEALHNVVKHARASSVRIALSRSPSGIGVAVEDDGEGFDPTRVESGHLGLTGMRQRAELAGGELQVVSHQGKGTRIEAFAPLAPARDE